MIVVHVSGIIITHLQEHKTTVTTASGNCYIYQIQNRTKNLKMGPFLGVLFCTPFLIFWARGNAHGRAQRPVKCTGCSKSLCPS
jgi:hypothetical protein